MTEQRKDSFVNGLKLGPKGTYIYRIKVNGVVRTGDTNQTDMKQAEKALIVLRAAFLQEDSGQVTKKAPTLKQALEDWKTYKSTITVESTWKSQARKIELHFVPKLGSKKLDAITKGDLIECLNDYVNATQGGKEVKCYSGMNQLIIYIGSLFKYYKELGYNINIKMPKREKSQEKQKQVLSEEELKEILKAIRSDFGLVKATAVAMGAYLGLRSHEIVDAKWSNVNWSEKKFRNDKTKGKESKPIPICDDLLAMLKEIQATSTVLGGYILAHDDGTPFNKEFLTYVLEKYGQKLCSKHITSHCLRGTFITILHNNGVVPKTLQLLARHANLSTTMGYVKVGEAEKEAAIDKVFNKKQA